MRIMEGWKEPKSEEEHNIKHENLVAQLAPLRRGCQNKIIFENHFELLVREVHLTRE